MTGESGIDWGFLLAMSLVGLIIGLCVLLAWLSVRWWE